jgi:serine/threonine-protein kinase Chk2
VHPDIPIKKDEITIGRKLDCDVRFEDPRISGNHCRLFRTPTEFGYRYFIEDLSSNGTFVNCRLVGKGHRSLLRTGDQISLVSKNSEKREFGCYVFKEIIEKREEALEGIFQHYDFVSELGSGNFSVVKLAMRKDTGEYFAVKVINKRKFWHIPKTREQIVREVEVLKTIKHVNIISYLEIYDTEDTLYIVLELATGGELFDRLVNTGPFKESEAKIVFRQMVEAVAYLHSQDIVHRDLKPENVLFVNKDTKSLQVKIADFGLARFIQEKEFMTTLCGTPQYVAPEIVRYGNKTDNSLGYSKAVDMWSLGVMLYIMLSGCPPFDEENNPSMNLYEQIENACYSFPLECWGDVSTGAINLIKALLQADPQKRLTAIQALRHPWIQQQARPVPAQVKRPTVLGKRVRAEDDKENQVNQVTSPTRVRACKKLRSDVSVTKLAAMKISDH